MPIGISGYTHVCIVDPPVARLTAKMEPEVELEDFVRNAARLTWSIWFPRERTFLPGKENIDGLRALGQWNKDDAIAFLVATSYYMETFIDLARQSDITPQDIAVGRRVDAQITRAMNWALAAMESGFNYYNRDKSVDGDDQYTALRRTCTFLVTHSCMPLYDFTHLTQSRSSSIPDASAVSTQGPAARSRPTKCMSMMDLPGSTRTTYQS